MKRIILTAMLAAVTAVAWSCAASNPQARKLAQGKYLVENVGMCADCHSPRNDKGEFDQARALQGSQLGFAPTVPIPVWAAVAPGIAGLPGMTEADAVRLLETGTTATGAPKRPPMPSFRFSHEDAEAVVMYLKSLNSKRS